jgi:hypothetical protein
VLNARRHRSGENKWREVEGGKSQLCSTPEGIGAAARKSAIALLNERVEEGDSGADFGAMVETGPKSTIRSQ